MRFSVGDKVVLDPTGIMEVAAIGRRCDLVRPEMAHTAMDASRLLQGESLVHEVEPDETWVYKLGFGDGADNFSLLVPVAGASSRGLRAPSNAAEIDAFLIQLERSAEALAPGSTDLDQLRSDVFAAGNRLTDLARLYPRVCRGAAEHRELEFTQRTLQRLFLDEIEFALGSAGAEAKQRLAGCEAASVRPNLGFIDHDARTINLKIAYIGAREASTINLSYVLERSPETAEVTTVDWAGGDIHFSTISPASLGELHGYRFRFHLYAVTTRDPACSPAKALIGSSVVVFIARADRQEETEQELAQLASCLQCPLVVQVHNADQAAAGWQALRAELGPDVPCIDTDAASGAGIFDTLKVAAKIAIEDFRDHRAAELLPP